MRHRHTLLLVLIISALGYTTTMSGQGLTTTAAKDDWEEINFEFNSSILSDGYPSLLRLAELLGQNPDYKVTVEGHTDAIGSDRYNDKLARARSETVKSFLLKYGAQANQVTTSGRGKREPKVDNRTKEARFINRRVVMTVRDGQGKIVSAGGVGDAIKALQEIAKKQEDCCNEILKKLDKLDEILAMLRDLKQENEGLKADVANLKQAQSGLKDQVASLPKPPEKAELAQIMETTAKKAIDESRPKRFALLGLNAGPDMTGNLSVTGKGRYFAPFGEHHALQAEAEYLRYFDRQEGQFDVGLVNRYKNFQAGMFSSFKRVDMKEYSSGGTLGQAAVAMDYLFSRGRIGMFGTKAFLDNPVIHRAGISRNIFEETYLSVVDQIGGSTQIGLHKDAYIEGNLGALFRKGGSNRPGGMVRFVQPINPSWAFTMEAGLNETLVGVNNSGRVVFGLQFGNWVRPKDFVGLNHPVPMDVPRVRYEVLKKRVRTGNDPPVADAGADQIGVAAGPITLDGSNSYDPDGDPITFEWAQTAGPQVPLSGMNTAQASFTAADGQSYTFRLMVKDDKGGESRARVTVTTAAAPSVKIVRFTANPQSIRAGETTTIVWEVQNADEVSISGLGKVDPKAGTSTVAPTQTTMYTLTAKNGTSEVSETLTVQVQRADARVLRFMATPTNINAGEAATLTWETENATEVSISGVGAVAPNGSTAVSPTQTTTYTLTAKNPYGEASAAATITVAPGPRIVRFTATPTEILPTEQSQLVWEVEGATEVTISGLGKVNASGTSTVSPPDTTTYVLTAKGGQGDVTASAVVTVIKPAKILDFVADPPRIGQAGDATTLRWQTENADEVIITGVGSVPVNGSVQVKPTSDVSYTLIAYGRRTQATALVIVRVATGGVNHPPVADAGPNAVTIDPQLRLDGSRSYDPDGDPITFSWRNLGPRQAEISNGTTPIPVVKFMNGWGDYAFELTVTDSRGASSTATVHIQYRDP
ncbi:MAG TPA: OmpA family protein [Bryobacteraceae bacterium]|nr:OmpA family protein [Bryobacteraceae bacterium]